MLAVELLSIPSPSMSVWSHSVVDYQQSVSLWPTTAWHLTPEFCVLWRVNVRGKSGQLWRHPFPFRQAMPEETSHKLGDLHVATMGAALPDAHSALGGVRGLRRILDERSICTSLIFDFCAPLAYFDAKDAHHNVVEEAKCTLVRLLGSVLSKGIINIIAESGLGYGHLKLVHQRDPQSRLRLLLADKSAGSCRVTAKRGIIDSIMKHFAENEKKMKKKVDYHVRDRYFVVIST